MRSCPLFVELCAGTAALSLRLHAGRNARPPVSRMGAKTGYADVILRCLGLRPGQGHTDGTRYLWCEPDAGVRLLLHAYTDRDLATAAADIIRSWKDEEPRALWERLRAEGPATCPEGLTAREVARWAWITGRTLHTGFKGERAATVKHKHSREEVKAQRAALGAAITAARTAAGLSRQDVSERVMGTRSGACWNWENGQPVSVRVWPALRDLLGLDSWDAVVMAPAVVVTVPIPDANTWTQTIPDPRLAELPTLTATIHPDARAIDPPALPPGTVAYMDPPYLGTTGYAHDLGRPEVVALARRWADAGATVCISEAEPIPELVADGWHKVEITGERKGQRRTFSKQQREWLTMNRAPSWVPSVQGSLF